MSHSLISRSPDLKRLRDEGFEVEIRGGYLLVHGVPYLNVAGETRLGTLASDLVLAGDVTAEVGTHVAYFVGEHPCDQAGARIVQIQHATADTPLPGGLVAQHSFSNKPVGSPYRDYHHKMTRYIEIISAPVTARDPSVVATTFKRVDASPEDSVFAYVDTASSRAGIEALSRKLVRRVAIVGLGGTGSYVLDLIAKTPATEIHLFDGDRLLQHNAFRSPGAPSLAQLRDQPKKVDHFKGIYSNMHTRIVAHDHYVTDANIGDLQGFDVAFICVDKGSVRKLLMAALQATLTPFIDVGMGVEVVPGSGELWAVCRVTSSTAAKNDHIASHVSMADRDDDDAYARNIQIADLNMLNAAMAVIKWKKMCGFYADVEGEHHSTYSTNFNLMTSDERPN